MNEEELNRRRAVCMVHGWVYDLRRLRTSHRIMNSKDKTLAVGYERGEHWTGGSNTLYLGKPLLSNFDDCVQLLIAEGHAYE